jgi:hypothetical protein
MPRRVPDIEKIARLVGYKPSVHLDEIIERVIDYWTADQNHQSFVSASCAPAPFPTFASA